MLVELQGSQTDETCKFCKPIIESQDKHNSCGFCPKYKSAQTQALNALHGHHKNCPDSDLCDHKSKLTDKIQCHKYESN